VLFEDELSPIGTAFAGIVFAATATVAVKRNWPRLLAVGLVASVPQIAILVVDGQPTDWDRVLLAGVFSASYVAAAIGLHWTREAEGLPSLSATLVIVSGVLSGVTGVALFSGDERGWAMLVAALAFGLLAAALFSRPADRDLSALLGAVALALAAVGLAVILTGPALAIAWAAEAAVLAWLARRIDEPRYAIGALAYLGAAAVDAVIEAPPADLYEAVSDPARGALAPAAVALGSAVVAYYSREWRGDRRAPGGFFGYLEPGLVAFREAHEVIRWITTWLAGIAAVYAASLGVLGLVQALDDSPVQLAFERGHVLVLWGLVGVGLVISGRRRESRQITTGGLLLAGATLVQAATFDLAVLDGDRLGLALLVAAATGLATSFAAQFPVQRSDPRSRFPALSSQSRASASP
jgi:putative effector of murein hydrolase